MDLGTVEAVVAPTSRATLWPLERTDAVLAGGTWLFSEPQPGVRRLVDLTALGWPPVTVDDGGIDLAATCTLAEMSALSTALPSTRPDWQAAPLFHQCCTALLASFKIWRTATVGGNVCLSFPAGAMISLLSALDGEVTVWRSDGADYRLPVTDFVTGSSANVLASGDVLRSAHVPAAALRARTAYRKLAPSALGRSGVVVIGRRDAAADGGRVHLSVTAATVRPYVFSFDRPPHAADVRAAHATIPADAWTDDPHGDPDWRRAMTLLLADEVCAELS
ncbi:FAD binding domain-containing protein [Mycolicibacterium grossiae]|uniref:FAD-binding molybdopterin dehydrogenase n=1 Tax=Mycolicibacterium grossiae TaxID=1552759 RepID=A0A1E8Q2L9_9MYCO|nr:FAD binding domain-containing protein [Mycolicibacterium grossiae]OFJ52491.1 FAD-binding molybdopterin dehydrogenase [Mycolicibacterium grossiae]QEM45557.1 FAD-binding molybdopterin dehydrogenase [Mycolicibacterium grossiae]